MTRNNPKPTGTSRKALAFMLALPVTATAVLAGAVQSASAAPKFERILTHGVGTFPTYAMVRTTDGTLHLVFQTTAAKTAAPDGLATRTISPSGALGAQTQALSDWGTGVPGLVRFPSGRLEVVFGALSPKPHQTGNIWAISSVDSGATWDKPTYVGSGILENQAYTSGITAEWSGQTTVLTVPQPGGLVVQRGFGIGSPTSLVTNSHDDFVSDVDSAVDAETGAVVASWDSLAHPGGDFIQGVAPSVSTSESMPGIPRNEQIVAGRDQGPGIFAAYTTNGKTARLLRYGGGTENVGSIGELPAKALGVATGLDGRIWVMWGNESAIAVTRSNKAVTRFEPIQLVSLGALTLYRIAGDGRLGPLDLLVDDIPNSPHNRPGTFYAQVLPELSAAVAVDQLKSNNGQIIQFKLKVAVTDAGDAVQGAKVISKGVQATTNVHGASTLLLPASTSGPVTVKVTAPTYQDLVLHLTL